MQTLEKSKLFPYVAWTLIIFFVLFTVKLTYELAETAEALSATSTNFEDH